MHVRCSWERIRWAHGMTLLSYLWFYCRRNSNKSLGVLYEQEALPDFKGDDQGFPRGWVRVIAQRKALSVGL